MIPQNKIPDKLSRIYFMAICGTGMASLAGLLKDKGYDVCGSDQNIYPPMSDELAKKQIPVFSPYSAAHLKAANPDLVVVGNAISASNVEASYLLESKIPFVSMPQALNHFFLKDKDVLVVSGTHGKTTTTALLAFLLQSIGESPSFLIGGVTKNLSTNFRIGSGKYFVIEGDEYDTAFFDKGPKFLHYNPKHVIITSLEFDHADIYRDLEHVRSSFDQLVKITPAHGSLHYSDEYAILADVIQSYAGFKRSYGMSSPAWQVANYQASELGSTFDIISHGKPIVSISWALTGTYNALNAASALSVLHHLQLDIHAAAKALRDFSGVKRRQDILYQADDLLIIDDFAHHPTAVEKTIQAIKEKYNGYHLIAVFEPRSNSSIRDIFQAQYEKCFTAADSVLLAPVSNPQKVKDGSILDVPKIVDKLLNSGTMAETFLNNSLLYDRLMQMIKLRKKPTVVLTMSNGGFENIPHRIAAELAAQVNQT